MKMSGPVTMNAKFWNEFARKFWEKKAVAIPQFESALTRIDDVQIFKMLVTFARICRKRRQATGFKFFVNGQRLHDEEVLLLLPVSSDKSLRGYHERMEVMYEDYCLVCDELLQTENSEFRALSEFTLSLYEVVGLPNRFAEIGLYLGNYRRTPFGIHVDGCGVFSFPVVGQKAFRLWSESYVRANPSLIEAQKYSRHVAASRLMTVGVGGMSYWPSKDWHIAESKGEFSATWSLGVWVDRTHAMEMTETFSALMAQTLGATPNSSTSKKAKNVGSYDSGMSELNFAAAADGHIARLPTKTRASISKFRQLRAVEVESFFLKAWMQHLSKQGFKILPTSSVKLGLNDRVQLLDLKCPILWARLDSRLTFAGNGVLVEAKTSAGFLRLVKALNAGVDLRVSDFLKGTSARADLATLQTLVGSLVLV